jgi:hypothetical protein
MKQSAALLSKAYRLLLTLGQFRSTWMYGTLTRPVCTTPEAGEIAVAQVLVATSFEGSNQGFAKKRRETKDLAARSRSVSG